MRIPRDLNGQDLAQRLGKYGYRVTRQSGSHMRLTRKEGSNEQHLTIPAHKPLRVGTLSQIIKDVAAQTGRSMAAVVQAVAG